MKIVVFSDTHLNKKFDQGKLNFLKKIVSSADKVIINGDFWEGYDMTFDYFLQSPWNKLFPYLKKKDTVYIYGNHDREDFADKRVDLFSTLQTHKYKFESGGKTFILEHGNRLCPFWDEKLPGGRNPAFVNKVLNNIEGLVFKIFKKKFINWAYQRFNESLKKNAAQESKKGTYLICGHTSCAEIDEENRYINSGFVKHGIGQYLVIENGKVEAKEEWY